MALRDENDNSGIQVLECKGYLSKTSEKRLIVMGLDRQWCCGQQLPIHGSQHLAVAEGQQYVMVNILPCKFMGQELCSVLDTLQGFWVSSSIAIHSEPICPAPEEATSYLFTIFMWAWPKNPSQLIGRKHLGDTFPGPAFLTGVTTGSCVYVRLSLRRSTEEFSSGTYQAHHFPWGGEHTRQSEHKASARRWPGQMNHWTVLSLAGYCYWGQMFIALEKKLDLCYNGCRESLIAFETFLSWGNFDLPWKTGMKTKVRLSRPYLWEAGFFFFFFGFKE